jgi:hypothetical protein
MKFVSASPIKCVELETDSGETFYRYASDNWEELIGMSQEPVSPYREEELEAAYNDFLVSKAQSELLKPNTLFTE